MLGTSSVNGIRLIKPKNFGTECKIIGSYSLISLFLMDTHDDHQLLYSLIYCTTHSIICFLYHSKCN